MRHEGLGEQLRVREKRRLAKQREIDARSSSQEKNQLGQFATPAELATSVVELASQYIAHGQYIDFLDPGLGTGVFFRATLEVFGAHRVRSALGFEKDQRIARVAEDIWADLGLEVRCADFTQAREPPSAERPNLIVCNPPYSRHHHLSGDTKRRLASLILQRVGISVNGLAGLYCHFLLLAHSWLRDGGIGLWLVPAEFMDVNYGAALRRYLSTEVKLQRLHLFPRSETVFRDALVSSCVVVFQKAKPETTHTAILSEGPSLTDPEKTMSASVATLRSSKKWSRMLQDAHFRTGRGADGPVVRLGDVFRAKRGVVTGANDFFILDIEQAKKLNLPRKFLRPILPSPRHVSRNVIQADSEGWPVGLPRLALLSCDLARQRLQEAHPKLDEYIARGEAEGLPQRYLLSRRNPWYSQEARPPAPIVFTYMGRRKKNGEIFRFIRNCSDATATNVYLMLYPKHALQATLKTSPEMIDRIFDVLSSLPNETYLREGRSYGGGLHKLEPRELMNLPLELPRDCKSRICGHGQLVLKGLSMEDESATG